MIVIGAGPAGLAMAGRLAKKGIPYKLFEKSDRVANSWEQFYDRLKLHTIKPFSNLPHFPLPKSYPTYVPKLDLIEYFHSYVDHFNIEPQFNETISAVHRSVNGWTVDSSSGSYNASNVVFCTGLIRKPIIPDWPGKESFSGELLHSFNYKNPKPFSGRKAVVVGMGNSGAEIALDLSLNNVETTLAVRDAVNIVPRDFLGNPTQRTARIINKLPYWLGDGIGKMVRNLTIGDLNRYGIKTSKMAPARQLREKGKTPVMDIGTVAQIKKGNIKVKPGVTGINGGEVSFEDGSNLETDVIIAATGYRPGIEELLDDATLLDHNGIPKYVSCPAPNEGLHFVGFDVYSLGIINSIYTQSEEVSNNINRAYEGLESVREVS